MFPTCSSNEGLEKNSEISYNFLLLRMNNYICIVQFTHEPQINSKILLHLHVLVLGEDSDVIGRGPGGIGHHIRDIQHSIHFL